MMRIGLNFTLTLMLILIAMNSCSKPASNPKNLSPKPPTTGISTASYNQVPFITDMEGLKVNGIKYFIDHYKLNNRPDIKLKSSDVDSTDAANGVKTSLIYTVTGAGKVGGVSIGVNNDGSASVLVNESWYAEANHMTANELRTNFMGVFKQLKGLKSHNDATTESTSDSYTIFIDGFNLDSSTIWYSVPNKNWSMPGLDPKDIAKREAHYAFYFNTKASHP